MCEKSACAVDVGVGPLPKAAIEQIVRSVEPFAFDRIYGGWWERVVASDAKAARDGPDCPNPRNRTPR